MEKKYLWQNENWPHFKWQPEKLINPLLELHTNQGILQGQMRALGFTVQSASTLERYTKEIKKSFEIEGISISENSLRSSIARKLGLENVILSNGGHIEKPHAHIDSIVNVITDAVQNCNQPLTEQRLFQWHKNLFGNPKGNIGFNGLYSIKVGEYRTDEEGSMRIISGYGKNEKIHFEAPPAKCISQEMKRFLAWINDSDKNQNLNSVIKSAISHLYFVEIHPFEDGNGRLARVISDMILCRGNNFSEEQVHVFCESTSLYGTHIPTDHLFSVSAQLCKERKQYYAMLQSVENSQNLDITQWLLWYVGCMNRAVLSVLQELDKTIQRKNFWAKAEQNPINERQRKILQKLLENFKGKMTSSKYAKICKCSQDTVSRDIEKLISYGIFTKSQAGGRSTEYFLNDRF